MKIKIETKHGTWHTTSEEVERAKWEHIGDSPNYSVVEEDDSGLLMIEASDDAEWTGIETVNLQATDDDGNAVVMHFSAAEIWSEDGRDSYIAYPAKKDINGEEEDMDWWNDEATVSREDDWEYEIAVCDLIEDIAKQDRRGPQDIDYESAVEEWMEEHTDEKTTYWMDDCRGFANEWTLYIDTQGRDEIMVSDLPDSLGIPPEEDEVSGLREVTRESAEKYIAIAIETPEDYRLNHACDKCVGAVVIG